VPAESLRPAAPAQWRPRGSRRWPAAGPAAVLRSDLLRRAATSPAAGLTIDPQTEEDNDVNRSLAGRLALAAAVTAVAALSLPAFASAHARLSPAVSLSGKLQLYSLGVPTEKTGLTTTKLVMTVPSGFGIDSFVAPAAPWKVQLAQTGSGDNAVVTKVTLTGGNTPTGEDTLFQFLAQPSSAKTYSFQVQQTYSDGSIVNWAGPESSAAPAPTIDAVSSIGGGGTSVLTIVALVLGALGLLAGGFALVGGSRERSLA
jgi:uncharacterized protein